MLMLIIKLMYYTLDHLLAKAQVAAIASLLGPQHARYYRSRLPESRQRMSEAAGLLWLRIGR